MSTYNYIFINGKKEISSSGYNLWNGAKNAGLAITRADRLSKEELRKPFNKIERKVWCVSDYGALNMWTVKQFKL